ncbi:hypothetical protein [Paenibacillus polysaccharolyticus]|uniref:hypothetical protein n=1 Tax=Paenibacillus polysaccharolyticus TaxID=582692 RepID=UPI00300B40C5
MLKTKGIILTASAALLLSLNTGIATASDTTLKPATVADVSIQTLTYQITLKVGETYQLPYGRNYKYYPSQYSVGGPYFSVTNSGLVRALKLPPTIPGEAIGSVGVVQEGVRDIAEVFIEITY